MAGYAILKGQLLFRKICSTWNIETIKAKNAPRGTSKQLKLLITRWNIEITKTLMLHVEH